ncbi:MAG: ExeM/NucH family extracellular endonuclease [Prosthecobacter sp.]
MRFLVLIFYLCLSGAMCAWGQLSYTGGTLGQNFDSLPASGSFTYASTGAADLTAAPVNAAGMSGWSIAPVSGTAAAKIRADAGASSTASHLSNGTGTSTERALGMLASSGYAGRAGLVLVNNSGGTLTRFTLSYTGEQWRLGGGSANTLTFAYAVGASGINTGTYKTVSTLSFTSPITGTTASALDGNAAANRVSLSATVTDVPWGPGQTLVLRWSDVNDSGGDDALAMDDFTFSAEPGTPPVITRIHDIQSNVVTSPMAGAAVTIEAVVTGDFQGANALGGFYVQESAADQDSDPGTSEGIFVSDDGSYDVSTGDVVRVTGTVAEVGAVTTIINPTFIVKTGTASLPAPVSLTMPPGTASGFERHEGMLVQFVQTLAVTDNRQLGSAGQLVLSSSGVIESPTESLDPNDSPASGTSSSGTSNVAAISAQESLNSRRQLVLDDGSLTSNPNPMPYLNAQQTRRRGDTTGSVTGFFSYSNGVNKIQPAAPVTFADANPRPATAPAVGGRLKIAGMNCLNYFTTLGSRGAALAGEFTRQQQKLVAEIIGLDADVVGLMEIENNGTVALDNLLTALNNALGGTVYARVPEPVGTGGDLIRVAMIYKTSSVRPDATSHTDGDAVWNRWPLAVVFTEISTDARFIACVNHFKSKTSTGATGADVDQNDGQGAFNDRRKQQASRLVSFLASLRSSTGVDAALAFGDLNSNSQEDPIDMLRAAGYTDLQALHDPGSYSYVFDGAQSHLDHAFATSSLSSQVTGAASWHINADEPVVLDYTQIGKTAAQQALYSANAFRAADHDPVLVGLTLTPPLVTYASWSAGIAWPSGLSGVNDDADQDSLSNAAELLQGTDPLTPDATLRPTLSREGGLLRLDYRQRSTVSGLTLVPQWSADLQQWTDLAEGSVLSPLTPIVSMRRVVFDPAMLPGVFLRLVVR